MWNFETKSSCDGFEEPLCYFAALLKRRGAVTIEQCEVVSMKKKASSWQAEELLDEIELQESELGILGKCTDTESASHTYS